MAADLPAHLQQTLGDSYTIERELGGGGMARVFVATETALARKVVRRERLHQTLGDVLFSHEIHLQVKRLDSVATYLAPRRMITRGS